MQGGFVKDILRKSVIFFGGWTIFYRFLTLNLPLKKGPRHSLALKLTEDALEDVFVEDILRKSVIFFGG